MRAGSIVLALVVVVGVIGGLPGLSVAQSESVEISLWATGEGGPYIHPGESTEVRVAAQKVPDGVSSFELTIELENPEEFEIVSATGATQTALTDTSIAEDGSSITIRGESTDPIETEYPSLARVTVRSTGDVARSELQLSHHTLTSRSGSEYSTITDDWPPEIVATTDPIGGLRWQASDGHMYVGTQKNYTLALDSASGGVGGFDLTVNLSEEHVDPEFHSVEGFGDATISEVSVPHETGEVTIQHPTERAASIEAGLLDTQDTGTVTLATVTVRATAPGVLELEIDYPSSVHNESGQTYRYHGVPIESVVIKPEPKPLGSFDAPPADTDGDNRFEDVNGDGSVNIADVQALYAHRNGEVVKNDQQAFDFTGDHQTGLSDVRRLFSLLSEGSA